MGVSRYSRTNRKWEERFDDLQHHCHLAYGSPTIGELLAHGITRGKWRCRNTSWQDDGRGDCWHSSDVVDLTQFGPGQCIAQLRRRYVCSACGRDRPFLELLAE